MMEEGNENSDAPYVALELEEAKHPQLTKAKIAKPVGILMSIGAILGLIGFFINSDTRAGKIGQMLCLMIAAGLAGCAVGTGMRGSFFRDALKQQLLLERGEQRCDAVEQAVAGLILLLVVILMPIVLTDPMVNPLFILPELFFLAGMLRGVQHESPIYQFKPQ